MPRQDLTRAAADRRKAIEAIGTTEGKLRRIKPRVLSDAQRASALGATVSLLRAPVTLTPAQPKKGKSALTLHSCMMSYPVQPAATGMALFSSLFQGAVFPGCQVEFMRIKKGRLHLVEFHVVLHSSVTYKFRIFTYPLAEFQDVAIPGGGSKILTALAPPVDEISGDLELGAAVQQRNSVEEAAGWTLHSVRVSTTS
ncbi:MAG TPA: hypothetical protein VF121_04125 [Thermoanaerobaculia bacterium]|nr:hypothetical protein [Thermoanaerobaculia bacterium]